MILVVDERFRHEVLMYRLCFTCESCAWFDGEDLSCSHGYPNESHRGIDAQTVERVVFCKEFELA